MAERQGWPAGRALVAVLAVAVLLRLPRVAARWDEVALAYAAYLEPAVRALRAGEPGVLAGTWVGLHPPLYAALFAVGEVVAPVPLLWLLGSVAASVGAVALVSRAGGPVAGLVLATAPLQLAYAAEVNNYPLAVLAVAAVLAAARARVGWLVAAATLACWAHVLGAAAAAGVVAWRLLSPRRSTERAVLAVGALLGALPVVAGALRLALRDSTYGQPDRGVLAWLQAAAQATGPEGLVLGLLVLVGLRRAALAAWLPVALVLAVALVLGAAAPHQRPYLLLLGPPAAVAIGRATQELGARRWVLAAVVLLCGLRGLRAGAGELQQLATLAADQQQVRAVDLAVREAVPGDTLWLISPALQPDDDKTATSAVLWRIPPWWPMPIARPVPFEYGDWRYGQPRRWQGRTVHTSTELHEAPFDHVAQAVLARGGTVWVVLYDHAPATGLLARVQRGVSAYRATHRVVGRSEGLGDDHLWQLQGHTP